MLKQQDLMFQLLVEHYVYTSVFINYKIGCIKWANVKPKLDSYIW